MRKLLIGLAATLALATFPAAAGAGTASHAPVRFDPNKKITQSTSSNWAGLAVTGGGFTTVTSSWVQPTATCTNQTTYSSFWVGLDGDGSGTVEQTGTDADCSGGVPSYYAWYEMYPKYPVNLGLSIQPGDHLTATVTYVGNNRFSLTITDSRSGTFSTTQKGRGSLFSAEAIAEAPSSRSGVLPLTNFGTVNFTGTTVNGQAIGSYSTLDSIDMVSGSTTKASTSQKNSTDFSVAWKHA